MTRKWMLGHSPMNLIEIAIAVAVVVIGCLVAAQ
jgi:hypothetical protein